VQKPARAGEGSDAGSTEPGQAVLMDMDIGELRKIKVNSVTSASKYEQKVTEAPSSVTIVTADEIRKFGYRTLADVLRGVRGFVITNDRAYTYAAVRGFGRTGDWNSRILVQVDGHRMNEIAYNSVYVANEFILDVDLIDRIEIIRGPSSSLYGDNAFFAVINILTRKGRDIKGVEVSGDAGSLETYKGRLTYGNRFNNDTELVLSGTGLRSDGQERLFYKEFADPATNDGVAEDLDHEKNYSAFAKYSSGDITLEGAYVGRKKGVPTASYGAAFNDPRWITVDYRTFLDLKYDHSFARDLHISARLHYDQYWYHADLPYPPDPLDLSQVVLSRDFAWANWWGTELQITKELFERHKIVAGMEYQNNMKSRFENYDVSPYSLNVPGSNHRSKKRAFFTQDEFQIVENLILNAGVRYDHYDTFGGTTNPRLALIYNPVKKSTIKLLYGTAFRAPSANELYYSSAAYKVKGNPDAKPEKITTYELVYEQYFGDHYLMTLAGFDNKIKDLLAREKDLADGFLIYRNLNEVRAQGLEAELEGKWRSGIGNKLSYTYTRAKDVQSGETLVNTPTHMVKEQLSIPVVRESIFTCLEVLYMSRRLTFDHQYAAGHALINVTVFSHDLPKNLDLSASVFNIFDKRYGDPGSREHVQDIIEQDGRSYRFKATYRF
jgi:iron complex outermembrane receptor protein